MQYSKPLRRLIGELSKLPGIKDKSAQRYAFHLLSLEDSEALALADAIVEAKKTMKACKVCGNLTDGDICPICSDDKRRRDVICVVETPQDVMAMERIKEFTGRYHVLNGVIAPMQGIGPEDINLKSLIERLRDREIKEVILATNPSVEGEATAMYIARLIKPIGGVKVTRIAHGLPIGGDLEYADEDTLLKSLEGRTEI